MGNSYCTVSIVVKIIPAPVHMGFGECYLFPVLFVVFWVYCLILRITFKI